MPVEVPQIPFVVTSRLDILSCRDALGEYRFAAIDQSLLAELSLQCSRYWANESGTASGEDSVRVTYEVQASPDVWLIGGQRKGQFTPKVMWDKVDSDVCGLTLWLDVGRRGKDIPDHPAASKDRAPALPIGRSPSYGKAREPRRVGRGERIA